MFFFCVRLFDLKEISDQNHSIKNIRLKLQSDCFGPGCIQWSLAWSTNASSFSGTDKVELSDVQTKSLPFKMVKEASNQWKLSGLTQQGLVLIKVRADLTGGDWQKTQLFRQSLSDDQNLFDVCFYFE